MLQFHRDPYLIKEGLATELAVIIPTFKERENIDILLEKIEASLLGIGWEAIFVDDDSTDGTVAQKLEKRAEIIHASAVFDASADEGMQSTFAPLIAVTDSDLQHDEALLAPMLEILRHGEAEVVVSSRYAAGGGM